MSLNDILKSDPYFAIIISRFDQLQNMLEKMIFQKKTLDGEEIWDTQDLCLLLKVSDRTLFRYRKQGLPYYQIAGKTYYKKTEVEKYLAEKSKTKKG